MKHLGIHKPCTENWDGMTSTEKGAFCQKCCKQVIDFTNQTSLQIRQTLFERKGQEVCGRIEEGQLETLNRDFEAWRQTNSWSMQRVSFYAFLFVFGLSIVSCAHQEDEKQIIQLQETAQKIIETKAPQTENISVIEHESVEINTSKIDLKSPPKQKKNQELDCSIDIGEVVFTEQIEQRYLTMGAMIPSSHYVDYLEEVILLDPEVDKKDRDIPLEFNAIAFPNPTQGRTTLKFDVPETTNASFELYSITGERIRSMGTAEYQPGTFEIPFDLSREKTGTYIIAILSKGYKESVKVIKQ